MTDEEQSQLRQSLNEQFHQMMVEPIFGEQVATEAQWSSSASKH